MDVRILFIGDIVGDDGLKIACERTPIYIKEHDVHFVIANIENSHHGKGGSIDGVKRLKEAGVHVFTGGNHTWDNFAFHETLKTNPNVLRPLNYPSGSYGKGYGVYSLPNNMGEIAVINLQGRVFMPTIDCPYRTADSVLHKLKNVRYKFIDFHAEATAEKISLAWYLDGQVSTIVGTHTHVPTADAQVFPKGTGYCSDIGMTGPTNSIIGMEIQSAFNRFYYQTPHKYECATGASRYCAMLISLDEKTGNTKSMKPIIYPSYQLE